MEILSASWWCKSIFHISNYQVAIADTRVNDTVPIMVCLQRRLDEQSDGDRERAFFSHTLEYLTALNEDDVVAENWMITSYEVEFGHRIGVGGLYVCLQDLCISFAVLINLCPIAERSTKAYGTRPKLRSRSLRQKAVWPQVRRCVTSPLCYGWYAKIPIFISVGYSSRNWGEHPSSHFYFCISETWDLDMVGTETYEHSAWDDVVLPRPVF